MKNLVVSPNIPVTKRMRLRETGRVSCTGNRGNAYRGFVRISEGKRQLGTPIHRMEGIIKMDIRERRWVGVKWAVMAEDSDE